MNWYLVYELTHFLLIIWRCRSFSTHCFHHFKKLLYDIFYFYIGIRIRKRNLKCGVSFLFFFENYEKHVIEEKKITIHKLYSECSCGVVKFHRGAKIHSLRVNKAPTYTVNLVPSVVFLISHPYETIHLTLIQYEGGGKTMYYTICP